MGAHGLEPWTSSLSETRSNQLSYAPGHIIVCIFSHSLSGCRTVHYGVPGLGGEISAVPPLSSLLLIKEVIQPQVPLRLPCYDFIPVIETNLDACLPFGLARRLRVAPTSMM